jgi:hypothetical protein
MLSWTFSLQISINTFKREQQSINFWLNEKGLFLAQQQNIQFQFCNKFLHL